MACELINFGRAEVDHVMTNPKTCNWLYRGHSVSVRSQPKEEAEFFS